MYYTELNFYILNANFVYRYKFDINVVKTDCTYASNLFQGIVSTQLKYS